MSLCWYEHFGTPDKFPGGPGSNICEGSQSASGFWSCCAAGDTCLESSLCHFTHKQLGASGFYIRGCTDSNLSDSACATYCRDQNLPDVKYDYNSTLWACCGGYRTGNPQGDVINCANPTNETFEAPPPEILLQQGAPSSSSATLTTSLTSSASSASSTSSTSSTTPTTSPSISAAPAHSSTLSAGAAAGIGVGAAIGVLAIVGAITAIVWSRRRRKSTLEGRSGATEPVRPMENTQHTWPREYPTELGQADSRTRGHTWANSATELQAS